MLTKLPICSEGMATGVFPAFSSALMRSSMLWILSSSISYSAASSLREAPVRDEVILAREITTLLSKVGSPFAARSIIIASSRSL
ncbi:hypothetical protein D9M71_623410 [compost metagenome]